LASLTKAEAVAALAGVLKLNLEELEILVKDRTIPALTQWAARIALHGIKQGDQRRLDFMFDRLIGKVPQPTEIEIKQPKPVMIKYPDGENVYLGPPKPEIEGEVK
jgi:hypothetical protein